MDGGAGVAWCGLVTRTATFPANLVMAFYEDMEEKATSSVKGTPRRENEGQGGELDKKMTNLEAAFTFSFPQEFHSPGPPDNIAALQCWLWEALGGHLISKIQDVVSSAVCVH